MGPARERAVPDFFGPEVAELYRTSCGAGPLPGRLHPDLVPRPGDLYAAKTAPSAFFPGRCELPDLLAARGVDTVLIAGTVTNVCCESSARDAATLGHRVVMVADANAAGSDDQHNATLHTFYRSFGDVRATADVLAMIAAGAGAGAGADRGGARSGRFGASERPREVRPAHVTVGRALPPEVRVNERAPVGERLSCPNQMSCPGSEQRAASSRKTRRACSPRRRDRRPSLR
ncbi:isochorismatase family cysteine hydrolase [Actinomadura sp. J1-007]|uniref:isochorismatase family cysteine hydrolase n=1 Tax=Actinomadura sp. J1-007 TaxID=2661913 RepID=UPI0019D65A8B|nr:isochorismatase family cysteine hydrolase [Actinomadura sp. J1-007]